MALNDIPKFQAAISEDADLQSKMKSLIKTMTADIGMPLNADSDVDWTPLVDFAKGLNFEFSVNEVKEAIFGNGRELSEEELDAAVGAGGLFSLASFGDMNAVLSNRGGMGDDTIHGVTKGGMGDDTIHGVTKGGMGDDTIHGKTIRGRIKSDTIRGGR